jgi:uncharacterized protein
MKLLDANVLLYAYDASSHFHSRARPWLEELFTDLEPVWLPWSSVHAFLRIGTNPRILENPFSIEEATAIVSEWLDHPTVSILEPGTRYWPILCRLLPAAQARGNLVMDAHLAALAIEHGATLYSTDRDFTRFEGLKWQNPLEYSGWIHEGH